MRERFQIEEYVRQRESALQSGPNLLFTKDCAHCMEFVDNGRATKQSQLASFCRLQAIHYANLQHRGRAQKGTITQLHSLWQRCSMQEHVTCLPIAYNANLSESTHSTAEHPPQLSAVLRRAAALSVTKLVTQPLNNNLRSMLKNSSIPLSRSWVTLERYEYELSTSVSDGTGCLK